MQKIIKNWQIVGFTDLDPILEEGYTAEEATAEEYQAWIEANKPQPEVFVSIFIPAQQLLKSKELRQKLDDALMLYSDIKRKTNPETGICEISNIALKFMPVLLKKEEYLRLKQMGVRFSPAEEIDALFGIDAENEETTV